MIKTHINDKSDLSLLCNLATQICGIRKGSLSRKGVGYKSEKYSVPRSVVSIIALKELGIHYNTISRQMNRHRTSIYHYEKKHESDYMSYPLYRETYNRIMSAHTDLRKNKKKFNGPSEMIKHLSMKGVKNSNDHGIKIHIKSEGFSVTVSSSFNDFSDNMRICNESLKDYNCKINFDV
tara:strand:- start:1562 stop:2098 length:537 start_codon:yes stop_codon:yes gene_type:complete